MSRWSEFDGWVLLNGNQTVPMAVADLKGEHSPMYPEDRTGDDNLQGLIDSIREEGLFNAPTVDLQGNIVSGFRRVRACRKLGLAAIPVRLAVRR